MTEDKAIASDQAPFRSVFMLVSQSFQPFHGRYQRIYNAAHALIKAGHKVHILAWDRQCRYAREEDVDGIQVRRFWIRAGERKGPVIAFSMIRFWWQAFLFLRRHKPDVIHCHNLDVLLPGYLMSRYLKAKAVYDACEPDFYAYWSRLLYPLLLFTRWIERHFTKRVDYCFMHNQYQVDKLRANGVRNVELIGSYPRREWIVDDVKSSESESVVIGRMGTIYQNNGIEELVEAFQGVARERPQVKLLLAGRVFDTYQDTFGRLVAPLGDQVEVIGSFSSAEMDKLYRRIDVSFMVYRLDEWFRNITPTKFFDSLAFGVPVIISDMGGIKDIMRDGRCGIVVESLDTKTIQRAILELVDHPDLRTEMARNGLRLIREKYNAELMAERLLKAYETL